MQVAETKENWEAISELIREKDREGLKSLIDSLNAHEVVHTMGHIDRQEQMDLLKLLSPEDAASVMEGIPEVQAIDLIEDMDSTDAAAIISEMESDDQADILFELNVRDAEAILAEMDPDDAQDVRRLISYDPHTAGGLMIAEFVSHPVTRTVEYVKADLRQNRQEYQFYHVRYVYVHDRSGHLIGMLQMQDLLFAEPQTKLSEILRSDVKTIGVEAPLEELSNFFDTYDFYSAPVVDDQQRMLGVLLRRNVLEQVAEQVAQEHLESQGIVGGDELRTMPFLLRSGRRLSWLSVNIILNIIAASVIAFHQDTLTAVISLAVFLPIISDMSGCSGNQAVAVSMRELSLGVVKPAEALRVWFQEISVGLINGIALGLLIGLTAFLWKGNIFLGLVVGGALAVNTIVAVSLGGTIPLILKRFNIDPALASGPILTTVTDMFGFFLTLTFASLVLSQLSGI